MRQRFILATLAVAVMASWATGVHAGDRGFAGSPACSGCHQEQYDSFMGKSNKAKSFTSVVKMADHLDDDEVRACLSCHSQAKGNPGFSITPEDVRKQIAGTPIEDGKLVFANLGCESCHGPAAGHAESGETRDEDGKPLVDLPGDDTCATCHEGIHSLHYKAMRMAGGH